MDYAHTADAMKKVLKTVHSWESGKIITVFGCGGDRDRKKRPVMGEVAATYSAAVILTSDNPRNEAPEKIISEIEKGVIKKGLRLADHSTPHTENNIYFIIENRRAAIQKAISLACKGDVVLISGKGHETYQLTGSNKIYFDDRKEARSALTGNS